MFFQKQTSLCCCLWHKNTSSNASDPVCHVFLSVNTYAFLVRKAMVMAETVGTWSPSLEVGIFGVRGKPAHIRRNGLHVMAFGGGLEPAPRPRLDIGGKPPLMKNVCERKRALWMRSWLPVVPVQERVGVESQKTRDGRCATLK